MTTDIYSLLASRFPADPDSPVIESTLGSYTYGNLAAESARYARFFTELGLRAGDRIAAQLEKTPHALFAYLGALRAGLVYLPLNTAYKSEEVQYFLEDSGASLLLSTPAALPQNEPIVKAITPSPSVLTLDELDTGTLYTQSRQASPEFDTVQRSPDDLATILYTSGTTGKPKGAMITHGNLASNALVLHRAWGWRPGDVLLHMLPIFHVHGLFVAIHPALLNGSKMIYLSRFDVQEVIDAMPRATVCMGVPTHYSRLLDHPQFGREICRNMRLFTSGSAPLLPQTFEEFRQRTGHTILERYGMTETGMNCSNPLNGERKAGTVGPVLEGVEARVVDSEGALLPAGKTGTLLVKGENVFPGYWGMASKTAESFTADGFFKTGDLASMDEEGYISIVGRDRDLIITGGLNVYPKEVELAIDQMDGVVESAVIGVRDPDFGEAVTAIVVTGENSAVTGPQVIEFLKSKLANFKVARQVQFVDELPRNAMGKVQKNLLRDRFDDS